MTLIIDVLSSRIIVEVNVNIKVYTIINNNMYILSLSLQY